MQVPTWSVLLFRHFKGGRLCAYFPTLLQKKDTPLSVAAEHGKPNALTALIGLGADVNKALSDMVRCSIALSQERIITQRSATHTERKHSADVRREKEPPCMCEGPGSGRCCVHRQS